MVANPEIEVIRVDADEWIALSLHTPTSVRNGGSVTLDGRITIYPLQQVAIAAMLDAMCTAIRHLWRIGETAEEIKSIAPAPIARIPILRIARRKDTPS